MYVLIESNTAAREAMADAIRLDTPQISRRVGLMRQISGAKVGASGRKPSPLANTNRESRPGRLDGQERLALACMGNEVTGVLVTPNTKLTGAKRPAPEVR